MWSAVASLNKRIVRLASWDERGYMCVPKRLAGRSQLQSRTPLEETTILPKTKGSRPHARTLVRLQDVERRLQRITGKR